MGVVVRASASGVSLSCIECKACDLGACVDLVDATLWTGTCFVYLQYLHHEYSELSSLGRTLRALCHGWQTYMVLSTWQRTGYGPTFCVAQKVIWLLRTFDLIGRWLASEDPHAVLRCGPRASKSSALCVARRGESASLGARG